MHAMQAVKGTILHARTARRLAMDRRRPHSRSRPVPFRSTADRAALPVVSRQPSRAGATQKVAGRPEMRPKSACSTWSLCSVHEPGQNARWLLDGGRSSPVQGPGQAPLLGYYGLQSPSTTNACRAPSVVKWHWRMPITPGCQRVQFRARRDGHGGVLRRGTVVGR